jgi:hypothetical protein
MVWYGMVWYGMVWYGMWYNAIGAYIVFKYVPKTIASHDDKVILLGNHDAAKMRLSIDTRYSVIGVFGVFVHHITTRSKPT